MKRSLLAIATLYTMAEAGGCLLVQPSHMGVGWVAYKTLAKVGVSGKFTSVKYTPHALEGKNFRELLVGSKVSIDVAQIDTGNKERDATLVKYFFGKLSNEKIEATIKSIVADPRVKDKPRTGEIETTISFNGKSLIIPMKYHYNDSKFDAKGTIDLADFDALPALTSINKSCYELHKGKTWSDVTIGFHTEIEATLCDSNLSKK